MKFLELDSLNTIGEEFLNASKERLSEPICFATAFLKDLVLRVSSKLRTISEHVSL